MSRKKLSNMLSSNKHPFGATSEIINEKKMLLLIERMQEFIWYDDVTWSWIHFKRCKRIRESACVCFIFIFIFFFSFPFILLISFHLGCSIKFTLSYTRTHSCCLGLTFGAPVRVYKNLGIFIILFYWFTDYILGLFLLSLEVSVW